MAAGARPGVVSFWAGWESFPHKPCSLMLSSMFFIQRWLLKHLHLFLIHHSNNSSSTYFCACSSMGWLVSRLWFPSCRVFLAVPFVPAELGMRGTSCEYWGYVESFCFCSCQGSLRSLVSTSSRSRLLSIEKSENEWLGPGMLVVQPCQGQKDLVCRNKRERRRELFLLCLLPKAVEREYEREKLQHPMTD